jgi:hypothetical protein
MWIIIDLSEPDVLCVVTDEKGNYTAYFESEQEAKDYAERMCVDFMVVEVAI